MPSSWCTTTRVSLLLGLAMAGKFVPLAQIAVIPESAFRSTVRTAVSADGLASPQFVEKSAEIQWSLPNYTKTARLYVIPELLSKDEAGSIIKLLPMKDFSEEADSVDSLPAFEYLIEGAAITKQVDQKLKRLTDPILESRVLPYVRERYQCPGCRVCTSMVRRYLKVRVHITSQHATPLTRPASAVSPAAAGQGERRAHPAHFDTQVRRALRVG